MSRSPRIAHAPYGSLYADRAHNICAPFACTNCRGSPIACFGKKIGKNFKKSPAAEPMRLRDEKTAALRRRTLLAGAMENGFLRSLPCARRRENDTG